MKSSAAPSSQTPAFRQLLQALKLDPEQDRVIVRLAAPIVGGMVSQTVLNLVDTAMVGRLSASALAAAGLGSTATWLSVSLLLGIGSATQALVARRMGEGQPAQVGEVLDNALVLAGASGLVVGALIYLLAPALFALIAPNEEVARLGTAYLRLRTLGFPFVVLNFAFRGFFHGIGDTPTYLKAIGLTNLANVVLDLLLIFGLGGFPRLEVAGAGLATSLALALGTAYYFLRALPRSGVRSRFSLLRWGQLSRRTSRRLIAILIPNGLQNLGTALGFMIFYMMMAQLGTVAVAVNNILMNLASAFTLPAMGMGLAAATLVGQALGRGQGQAAEDWGWETVRLASYLLGLLGLSLVFLPDPAMRLFTSEPEVINSGRLAVQVVGLSQAATGLLMVLSQALISAGYARSVMVLNLGVNYAVVLPLTYLLAVVAGGGVALAWVLQGFGRLVSSVGLAVLYRQGGWKERKL